MLLNILYAVFVLLCAALIGIVLLQRGKGATTGAAFGAGASGTVFGARGSASFLTRLTAVLATLFFAGTLGLNYLMNQRVVESDSSVLDSATAEEPALEEVLDPLALPTEEIDLPAPPTPEPATGEDDGGS